MHELIHAETWRKLLSLANQGDLDYTGWSKQQQVDYVNSIRNNFPGIYDYYRRHKNWQHQQMAQHYRSTIEQGLRDFNGNYPDDIYEALAWAGLRGEGGIDYTTGLTENPTVAWENLSQEERINYLNTKEAFIQNNPHCQ